MSAAKAAETSEVKRVKDRHKNYKVVFAPSFSFPLHPIGAILPSKDVDCSQAVGIE